MDSDRKPPAHTGAAALSRGNPTASLCCSEWWNQNQNQNQNQNHCWYWWTLWACPGKYKRENNNNNNTKQYRGVTPESVNDGGNYRAVYAAPPLAPSGVELTHVHAVTSNATGSNQPWTEERDDTKRGTERETMGNIHNMAGRGEDEDWIRNTGDWDIGDWIRNTGDWDIGDWIRNTGDWDIGDWIQNTGNWNRRRNAGDWKAAFFLFHLAEWKSEEEEKKKKKKKKKKKEKIEGEEEEESEEKENEK
ncbi:hypothetical protein EYF80_038591 [Liparis tanakae]|uniref:Uncharacterized protein n=1 Tax=Liparis tanakae TaxID=230148 RepID=A0A4Z2GCD2_9TELE|nr:hypothetical protein EYF80_038591 [Liparis tanakae]